MWSRPVSYTHLDVYKRQVPKVMVSIVDYDKSPQEIEACRKLAEDLGAIFRVRPFAG